MIEMSFDNETEMLVITGVMVKKKEKKKRSFQLCKEVV